jgi:nitrile hydratase
VKPAPGQRVRTRGYDAPGHTRLPDYARGHTGTVIAERGDMVLPDDAVRFGRSTPEPVYSVRFPARDLWGDGAGDHDVYLDLYLSYLEPLDPEQDP